MLDDLTNLFRAHDNVSRREAEYENAGAQLTLARAHEACAYLLSQYEPVHSLGIDRRALRVLLAYTEHHNKDRLRRETAALCEVDAQ